MTEEGEPDGVAEGEESGADGRESAATRWSTDEDGAREFAGDGARVPTDAGGVDGDGGADDLEIPLPWNTITREDGESGDTGSENRDGGATDTERADERDGRNERGPERVPDSFEDLRFVGPKSAAVLRDSEVSVADLVEKRVAYRDLTEAGVNPGVAAKIRREHSLSWSLDGGGTDLDRRSTQVRGLDDDERAWIAASSGWSEDGAETDGSGDAADAEAAWRARTVDGDDDAARSEESATTTSWPDTDATSAAGARSTDAGGESTGAERASGTSSTDAEAAWRRRSAPTPLTAIDALDEEVAAALGRAGIGSVRRLATADSESVADALDLDADRVESWRRLAREHESS
ncbi:DUF7409 domain-containing protein [Halobellus sp. GM3]|uniref:DUF7409 domain-containing protein n=1 Tax=Halobellus sp. GM3 TaxID=3458410 RepID=UPI00403DC74E